MTLMTLTLDKFHINKTKFFVVYDVKILVSQKDKDHIQKDILNFIALHRKKQQKIKMVVLNPRRIRLNCMRKKIDFVNLLILNVF